MTSEDQAIPVTVMIFTLNEEIHLPRCLESVRWCDDVIVVDSFSGDRTKEICEAQGIGLHEHAFEGFGPQRNWALDTIKTKHSWILILDADEWVPETLVRELERIARRDPGEFGAYRIRRRFHMWGRWLKRSALYPTWVVRFVRKGRVRYADRGHAETQTVDGKVGSLQSDLMDENLKGIDEWFERQGRYARKEAERELKEEQSAEPILSGIISSDPLRRRAGLKRLGNKLPCRGLFYFVYAYVLRGGFLEGRDGFTFCVMKAMYQQMIAVKKYDLRRRSVT